MSLKLISLNIEGNQHFDKIIPFLRTQKPDVICLQELFEVDIPYLEKHLHLQIHYIPTLNIAKPFRHIPARGHFGIAILTHLPVKSVNQQHYYGHPHKIPLFTHLDADNRAVLWLTTTKDQQDYTIATTHFTRTPNGKPNPKQRRDLKNLLKILDTIPQFVIAGDFNTPREYRTYKTLASRFTDHTPKNITTTIDPQLHYANQKTPGKLKMVVDHLFSTPHYQAKNVRVQCGLSDHCAIIAVITKKDPPAF